MWRFILGAWCGAGVGFAVSMFFRGINRPEEERVPEKTEQPEHSEVSTKETEPESSDDNG